MPVKGLKMAKKVWVKVIAYNWARAIIFFAFAVGYEGFLNILCEGLTFDHLLMYIMLEII